MAIPNMPWYGALNKALAPVEPYATFALLVLAAILVITALKSPPAVKWLMFIYMVSP